MDHSGILKVSNANVTTLTIKMRIWSQYINLETGLSKFIFLPRDIWNKETLIDLRIARYQEFRLGCYNFRTRLWIAQI